MLKQVQQDREGFSMTDVRVLLEMLKQVQHDREVFSRTGSEV
jgi:hypothetical protein